MAFHDFVRDEGGWAVKRRTPLFVHQYLEVDQLQLVSPSRSKPFEWTVCHRKAGVVIAAQTSGGEFILVRQERVPVRATLWEFPAGQIDEAGEHQWGTIVAAGLRELSEEAGYEPEEQTEIVPMHHYLSSPGFTDEHCYQIWVKGVRKSLGGMHLDENETITEVRAFSWEELSRMVLSGEIRDANTLCCFARLSAMRADGSSA